MGIVGQRHTATARAVGVIVCAAICLTSASFARASTALPFQGFGGIAVDDAHHQVFVSGSGTKVSVAGFDGSLIGSIDLGAQTGGLALMGSTLYVVLKGDRSVVPIDTGSLTTGAAIALPDPVIAPSQIVVASGLLWVGWGDCQTDGGLASVDPATSDIAVYASSTTAWIPSWCPRLSSSPALPDRLFAWDPNGRPAPAVEIETVGSPSVVGTIDDVYDGPIDVAVSPNGSKVIVAWSSAGYGLHEYKSSDLSPTGLVYDVGGTGFTSAVEVSTAGQVVAVADGYLRGFKLGRARPSYMAPGSSWNQALAIAADGLRGFGVESGASSRLFRFFPEQAKTSIQLKVDSNRIVAGDPVQFNVQLKIGPNATNRSVTIYGSVNGTDKNVVTRRKVNSSGRLVVRIKPSRTTQYWAAYGGDLHNQDATSGGKVVLVRARVAGHLAHYYATSNGDRLYHLGPCHGSHRGCPTLAIKVWPNRSGSRVDYHLQAWADGAWRMVYGGNLQLSRRSTASISLVFSSDAIGVRFRIQASTLTDNRNLAGESEWEYFKLTA